MLLVDFTTEIRVNA